ncbi:hypothetical protein WDZ16_09455 [Pseudokineococcus marinus]|uniref:Uncharacterized protein n=1 Tax=Pseudokineococcus marinus TaxID=351215 RepID=A0A849BET8_9ACTN|nr:hypothetical protein [Pseudokineococcus marinus]NNH21559.1 hypothetical protein [Pseudokineococcus marinus]
MTDAATVPDALPSSTPAPTTGAQRSFVEQVLRELVLRDPDGAALARVDAASAARAAVDHVLDAAERWTDHLGGFYDVDGVRRLLSRSGRLVSKQAVSKRRGLLALTTGSGRVVYPTFQFSGGSPLPGLDAVLREVPEPLVSRWTQASWLVSPQPDLGGTTPVQLLREGGGGRGRRRGPRLGEGAGRLMPATAPPASLVGLPRHEARARGPSARPSMSWRATSSMRAISSSVRRCGCAASRSTHARTGTSVTRPGCDRVDERHGRVDST